MDWVLCTLRYDIRYDRHKAQNLSTCDFLFLSGIKGEITLEVLSGPGIDQKLMCRPVLYYALTINMLSY